MIDKTESGNPASTGSGSGDSTITWTRMSWLIGGIVALAFFYGFCGFYSFQPIGAMPEGSTAIVWRASGEPFFNSPDGMCIKRMAGVSLMCRMAAMVASPVDRIILRLPYQRWAYLASTDGNEFSSRPREGSD
jgi:hypothetical protein